MKNFCDNWVKEWCNENGWTDLFIERYNYWAFPPGGFMPLPIPKETLLEIKARKGLSNQEKTWFSIAAIFSVISVFLTGILASPMPLVFAFAISAIIIAYFEMD